MKYYNPNLADSLVDLGQASTLDKINPSDVGTEQRLKNSGYVQLAENQTPQYAGQRTPQYDLSGNLLTKDAWNAQYNPQVDETAIKDQMVKDQQLRIDAINNAYNQLVKDQERTNQGRMGATRAMAARQGLLGSSMGEQQLGETAYRGQQEINAINAKKALEIASIYGEVSQAAREEVKRQQESAKKNAEDYQTYLSGEIEKSRAKLGNAAGAGLSWEDITAQAGGQLDSYVKNLGFDNEREAKNYYDALSASKMSTNKPLTEEVNGVLYERQSDGSWKAQTPDKETSPEYKYVAGSRYQQAGYFDPVTKQFVPLNPGNNIIPPRGTPPTSEKSEKQDKKKVTEFFGSVSGDDGFVSPDDYAQARNAWVKDGYSATAFDTNFKGYMNPNNPNYVTKKVTATEQKKQEEAQAAEKKGIFGKLADWWND